MTPTRPNASMRSNAAMCLHAQARPNLRSRSKSHLSTLLLSTVSVSLIAATAANAQSSGNSADIQLAFVDEITVSATRSPMAAFDYPGSVSVISREDIDDLMPSSITDLFDSVPGVQFSGGPRRTGEVPAIRGIQGEGVLVLFDGVRQNFLSGHDGQFFVEPDLLKSAEVVRGPASALYGSGALGGVLAFRMVDAADFLSDGETAGYRVKAGYQDVNEEWTMGGTAFARSEDGRFDGVANITYRNSGDISLGSGASLMSNDDMLSGIVKGKFQVTDGLTASLLGQSFNNDAVEPNNGQDFLATDVVDKDITSNLVRAGLEFNPANSDLINAEMFAYVNNAEVEESEQDSTRVISRKVETLGFVLDNRSRFALGDMSALTFTYGGEYYRDKQTGTDSETDSGTRGGVPNSTAKNYGLFLQAELSIMSDFGELIIIPAIRYDSFKNETADGTINTDDNATSPKIGITYKPVEWLMGFANYAQAFRAPGYNEIFADDIHFTIPLGPGVEAPNSFIDNLDLLPEESETWEIGGGVDFDSIFNDGDHFTAKASYFSSDVDNLIDLDVNVEFSPSCFVPEIPLPCTSGTSRYANVTNAKLSGFELEAVYDGARLYAAASYSSIDGYDKDEAEKVYIGTLTPNRFHISGGIKLPEIDGRFGARLEVASDFDKVNDEEEVRSGYEMLDLYFVWAPSSGILHGLRVDLGVDNVTDVNAERVFAGVSEPGRNYKVSTSWTQTF